MEIRRRRVKMECLETRVNSGEIGGDTSDTGIDTPTSVLYIYTIVLPPSPPLDHVLQSGSVSHASIVAFLLCGDVSALEVGLSASKGCPGTLTQKPSCTVR